MMLRFYAAGLTRFQVVAVIVVVIGSTLLQSVMYDDY